MGSLSVHLRFMVLCFATISFGLLAACAGTAHQGGNTSVPPGSGQPTGINATFNDLLPVPSDLLAQLASGKGASYAEEDYIRHGKEVGPGLPMQNTAVDADSLKFSPTWVDGAAESTADLAYGLYRFENVGAFAREPVLTYGWSDPPAAIGTAWLGVADWTANRWRWSPCNAAGLNNLTDLTPYTSGAGDLVVAVVAVNHEESALRYLRLGECAIEPVLSVTPHNSLAPMDVTANANTSTTLVGTLDLFEWDWDNDGVYDEDSGSSGLAPHTYSTTGTHVIGARMTNSYGELATTSQEVFTNTPWLHTLGGGDEDILNKVACDNNNIYAVGLTHSAGAGGSDVLLVKYSLAGELVWAKAWGGSKTDKGIDICFSGGDIYIIGETYSYGTGLQDIFLQRWTTDGNLLATKVWGGTELEFATSIVSSGGNLYLAGATESFGAGDDDAFVLKFDDGCNLAWQHTWGGSYTDRIADLATTRNLFTQTTTLHATGSYGHSSSRDLLYLKITEDGVLSTQRRWTLVQYQEGTAIATRGLIDVFIAGTVSEGFYNDVLLLALTSEPATRRWGGTNGHDTPHDIVIQNDSVIIAGQSNSFSDVQSGMLVTFSFSAFSQGVDIWDGSGIYNRFLGICAFPGNGVLAVGECINASSGVWTPAASSESNPDGTWTELAIALATPAGVIQSPIGTIITDITDMTIDSGGGGEDSLLCLQYVPD